MGEEDDVWGDADRLAHRFPPCYAHHHLALAVGGLDVCIFFNRRQKEACTLLTKKHMQ
jgi:hypothetical protein